MEQMARDEGLRGESNAIMNPSTSTAAGLELTARDEELCGECATAFACYNEGNVKQATQLLEKLLARHPAHPLLHYAHTRLAHRLFLEQRQLAGINKQFEECGTRAEAARNTCPGSLLRPLLAVQILYDCAALLDEALGAILSAVPSLAAFTAARPLSAADFGYAKAIATFDDEVFTLALFPDVRECADSAAYRSQALANLAKAPALITDLHREAGEVASKNPGQSHLSHFIGLRDAEHAAEAARRLRRVQVRASEEEAARELRKCALCGAGDARRLCARCKVRKCDYRPPYIRHACELSCVSNSRVPSCMASDEVASNICLAQVSVPVSRSNSFRPNVYGV